MLQDALQEVVSKKFVEWAQSRVRDMMKLGVRPWTLPNPLTITMTLFVNGIGSSEPDDKMSTAMYVGVDTKLVVIPGIMQIASRQNHILDGI